MIMMAESVVQLYTRLTYLRLYRKNEKSLLSRILEHLTPQNRSLYYLKSGFDIQETKAGTLLQSLPEGSLLIGFCVRAV